MQRLVGPGVLLASATLLSERSSDDPDARRRAQELLTQIGHLAELCARITSGNQSNSAYLGYEALRFATVKHMLPDQESCWVMV